MNLCATEYEKFFLLLLIVILNPPVAESKIKMKIMIKKRRAFLSIIRIEPLLV